MTFIQQLQSGFQGELSPNHIDVQYENRTILLLSDMAPYPIEDDVLPDGFLPETLECHNG